MSSVSKDDLILSNRQLQKGDKVVLLGNDVIIPVDNTQLNFTFTQLAGYDENNQPIMQQLSFNGSTPFLTNKQIDTDIVDINSVVMSICINEGKNGFPTQALGIYTITNTVSTNWNNYIWENENNYQIIKIDDVWVVKKDDDIYATNTTNNPVSNNWDNISNIEQTKFNSYQKISFFRCLNLLDNYTKWTGVQCYFNKNINKFVSTKKQKVFDVWNGLVPIEDCYYVVLDYKITITQCYGYYYEHEDIEKEDYIQQSSSSDSSDSSLSLFY